MTTDVKTLGELFSGSEVGQVRVNEPLSAHNTWKIGGPAAVLVEPANADQVGKVLTLAKACQAPVVVIGQGSNLLFDDLGVRGVVLKIGSRMAGLNIVGEMITAAAGVWVPQLARRAMAAGLSGLEHCIGIPGTIGGLVMMNGGSHRHGIGENIVRVQVVTAAGESKELSRDDCRFSYRHSALQGSGCVVTGVELLCAKGDRAQIRSAMVADLRNRRHKFPRKLPNCGSVFLSTAEMHATVGPPGKIIEEAGLKGVRVGQAEISRQHANFIVNLGQARSADVLALIRQVRTLVMERIGFDMKCEVRYVSPEGEVMPAHRVVR